MESEQGTEIKGSRIVVEWSRGYKDKTRGVCPIVLRGRCYFIVYFIIGRVPVT